MNLLPGIGGAINKVFTISKIFTINTIATVGATARLCCLITLLLCNVARAASSEPEINSLMQEVSDSLITLLPLVHDRKLDRDRFETEVDKMAGLIEQAGPHFAKQPLGSQVTYTPGEIFKSGAVDLVVRGGPEYTARDIARRAAAGEPLSGIEGTSRVGEDGEVFRGAVAPSD